MTDEQTVERVAEAIAKQRHSENCQDEWWVDERDTRAARAAIAAMQPALAEAEARGRNAGLQEAIERIGQVPCDIGQTHLIWAAQDAIRALIDAETDPQADLSGTSEPQAAKPSVQEAARYIHDLITSRMLPAREGQAAIDALIAQEGE